LAYRRFHRSEHCGLDVVAGKNAANNLDTAKLVGLLHAIVAFASESLSNVRSQCFVGLCIVPSGEVE
jgi:hypothetical protein